MLNKLNSWLRWKIAWRLQDDERYCWSQLIMWAQFPEFHPFSEIFQPERGYKRVSQCQREANEIGCCWCGRYQNEQAAEAWVEARNVSTEV